MAHTDGERIELRVRIPAQTADQLKTAADTRDCSITQLVRSILAKWTREHPRTPL